MNFTLPNIPERPAQPRNNGVTMMMDKGLSMRQAEDFLDASAAYTDIIKLGFGTSYLTKNLKEKIDLYHNAGMKVYLGGTLFEAFMARNRVDDYERVLEKFGLNCLEVSDGSMKMDHDEKCNLISRFAKNYTVLSEVGSKEEGILIHPSKWIEMMDNELQAGSWKVIAEARESGNVGIYRPNGSAHSILVSKILSKINSEDILWEAPKKAQQVWFIKLLGANVNLGNIAHDDVIPMETLRIGLRGDTFFDYLPESIVEQYKP